MGIDPRFCAVVKYELHRDPELAHQKKRDPYEEREIVIFSTTGISIE
jgi:hypothetical protein